jgi:hypothetical protein
LPHRPCHFAFVSMINDVCLETVIWGEGKYALSGAHKADHRRR